MGGYFGDFLGGSAEFVADYMKGDLSNRLEMDQLEKKQKLEEIALERKQRLLNKLAEENKIKNFDHFDIDTASGMAVPKSMTGEVVGTPRKATQRELDEERLRREDTDVKVGKAAVLKKQNEIDARDAETISSLGISKARSEIAKNKASAQSEADQGYYYRQAGDAARIRAENEPNKEETKRDLADLRDSSEYERQHENFINRQAAMYFNNGQSGITPSEANDKAEEDWDRRHPYGRARNPNKDTEDAASRLLEIRDRLKKLSGAPTLFQPPALYKKNEQK